MSASSRAKATILFLFLKPPPQFHVEMRMSLSSVLMLHCLACGGNRGAETAPYRRHTHHEFDASDAQPKWMRWWQRLAPSTIGSSPGSRPGSADGPPPTALRGR